jgi:hypothetical protein
MVDLSKLEKKKTAGDISAESAYTKAVTYLQATDWQVIAQYERGRAISDDVAQKRKAALDIVTGDSAA